MKLGTLLLRDAVISLSQLESALRAQVLYGGRLGTNLVELSYLDLDTLAVYLGRSLEMPIATRDMFEAADADTIASFERGVAELYGAFPLGVVADENGDPTDTLAIALVDPNNRRSLEQLAGQLRRPVAPYVAPELRLYYYLERHYAIERQARYVRTGTHLESGSADERRREQPPRGIEMPKAMRFEPKRPARDASGGGTGKRKTDRLTPAAAPAPKPRLDKAGADAAIAQADARNQIADAFINYCIGRCQAAAVMILRDANAMGWRVYAPEARERSREFERVNLALGGASALQAAHDSRQPYRGAAPTAGRQVEQKLWAALGCTDTPGEMLVVPVLVKTRVVNLVYAQSAPSESLSDEFVDDLVDLTRRASDAYIRLIQKARAATADGQ